mmetsp:Transcript_43851/g.115716  ORF Transcript_43851/g.115716 Transcript_43851/m.115716 type:complete len:551 (+) Transcript_43851:192-1844(+)
MPTARLSRTNSEPAMVRLAQLRPLAQGRGPRAAGSGAAGAAAARNHSAAQAHMPPITKGGHSRDGKKAQKMVHVHVHHHFHTTTPVEDIQGMACTAHSVASAKVHHLLHHHQHQQPRRAAQQQAAAATAAAEPPADVDLRVAAEYWGVTVGDLCTFYDEIKEDMDDYRHVHRFAMKDNKPTHLCCEGAMCKFRRKTSPEMDEDEHKGVWHEHDEGGLEAKDLSPDMHLVVARYIKPKTKHYDSFSRMLYPKGLKINRFVTHSWSEKFSDFVSTLAAALNKEVVVWVCSFALNQNASISDTLGKSMSECPFYVALKQATMQVVVLDSGLEVPMRSWCCFELAVASQFGIPTFLWPHPNSDLKRLQDVAGTLDLRNARATMQEDKDRIERDIERGIGFDALNRRLRDSLDMVLRLYSRARESGIIAELDRQLEKATKRADEATQKALRTAKLMELWNIQEAAAHEQRRKFVEVQAEKIAGLHDQLAEHEQLRKLVEVQSEELEEVYNQNAELRSRLPQEKGLEVTHIHRSKTFDGGAATSAEHSLSSHPVVP